ncbi:MAG: ATP-binding protein, partial [Polyangiaceae bacterium]
RRYDITIKPVENDAAKFLVVVLDVTDQLEDRARMRAQAETLNLVRRMLVDRSAFEEFVADASATIDRIISHQGDPISQRRDLHTLKGNALLAGLDSIADICRELEELALDDEPLDQQLLTKLQGAWLTVSSEVEEMMGTRSDEITIARSQYRALLAEVDADGTSAALYRRLEDLDRQPVGPRLERLKGEAERIARTLDKPVRVAIMDDGIRVAGDGWAPFWAALIHAVRNAVDHGLEPRAERLQSGKGLTGNVWLRARRGVAGTVVEVGDDGKGIDWEAVRERAAAKGRASTSEADLIEAVFQGGISTLSTPSEFSGRGVGLGALHQATRRLGGRMKVHSVKGQGTLLEMQFDDPEEEPVSRSREHRSALWTRDDCAGS